MDIERIPTSTQLDELYQRMDDDLERKVPNIENSDIARFFVGKTLFVTGATGFMGKCLVEKLLRSCSDLKHMYILMRDRNNQGIELTLKKFFAHPIFDLLRKTYPNFGDKVTAIKGDLCLENLGISDEDRNTLINEVNIMYHNAANVKFDARVKLILSVNILGTKNMLDLAKDCKQMKLFMYISSAYSHCYRKDIDETFYSISDDLDTVYDAIKRDSETEKGLSEEAINTLKGKFVNVYVYTKAFSENLVKQYAEKNPNLAFGIYRPSIVLPAYREPLSGWCDNTNGPIYFFLAVGLGMVHVGYHHNSPQDYIPVDMTINALLAITWDLGTRWKPMDKPSIYNYGSSTLNPYYFLSIYKRIKIFSSTDGSAKAVWMHGAYSIPSYYLFFVLHILLHFIPACLGDLLLIATGRKPIFVSIFLSTNKHMDKIIYFSNGDWRIHCTETMKVIERMNYDDKELFYCDIRKPFTWEEFALIMWRGLRLFILKENLNSKAGRRKYVLLWYLHYGFLTICYGILFYCAMKIFGFLN